MDSDFQPKRKPNVDNRYDVNRTLTSYQPTREVTQVREAVLDPNQPFQAIADLEDTSVEHQAPAKAKRRFGWKRAVLLLFVVLLTPVLVIGIWDYRNASAASQKMFGSSNLLMGLLPTGLENSNGRTNILVIGNSVDDNGHGGAALTDTILIISLDKEKKTGFMLSVPRDLYVGIPDYGSAKINEAYQAGEQMKFKESGYQPGGVGLLSKVIKQNFDLDIHYSVTVSYNAVKDITNSLDGITVNIKSTDPRGIYDPNFRPHEGGPLKLTNGSHEIDGQTALRLTRARGSTYGSYGFPRSDFDRTKNQQKVFAAIKSEISPKFVLDPRENKDFFNAVANNVKTDIGLREVLPLYLLMNSVPDPSMKQINLSDVNKKNYLASYGTPSGQSALIPAAGIHNFSEIQALIKGL
jgi:LCP family protein required for cell wall assembly